MFHPRARPACSITTGAGLTVPLSREPHTVVEAVLEPADHRSGMLGVIKVFPRGQAQDLEWLRA